MKARPRPGRNVTCTIAVPGGAGLKPDPAPDRHLVVVRIAPADPNAPPVKRPPSSKTIARQREKAEAVARNAATAEALRAQVQRTFRPPPGKLFGVDATGLLLIGPAGALGTSNRMARTLEPLAAGGRHLPAALVAAGSWQDEAALREALDALAPKLAALGLRICRRKAGIRMAKVKPTHA